MDIFEIVRNKEIKAMKLKKEKERKQKIINKTENFLKDKKDITCGILNNHVIKTEEKSKEIVSLLKSLGLDVTITNNEGMTKSGYSYIADGYSYKPTAKGLVKLSTLEFWREKSGHSYRRVYFKKNDDENFTEFEEVLIRKMLQEKGYKIIKGDSNLFINI